MFLFISSKRKEKKILEQTLFFWTKDCCLEKEGKK